jgi:N-(2-amino-2-carboxyethyl)-L-glutamate synthase
LIRLTRVFKDSQFQFFAKLEGINPGGGAKDRPALNILKEAMEAGEIGIGTVVVESSSGNFGIGLAQACRYFGLRFICVIDPQTTGQNVRILQAYGAEIDIVSRPDPVTGGASIADRPCPASPADRRKHVLAQSIRQSSRRGRAL